MKKLFFSLLFILPLWAYGLTYAEIEGVDAAAIQNKKNVLDCHIRYYFSGQYTVYNYQFKQLTPEQYQAQKPADNLSFDAGFVDASGVINISEPTTTEQKALFPNLTKVALYYMCQSYMYNFYQTRNLPLILKVGFGMYEAGLLPSDSDIKTAVNNYGNSLSSFDLLNDVTNFSNNKGYLIAGVFGEFMNIYKNWAYQYILNPTPTGFYTDINWFNTNSKEELLADFNRYLYARFLQPDENLRVKMCVETEHFKFYSNQKAAAINFPYFSDVCETAYNEYVQKLNVQAYEKITFFTMIGCEDGDIEGLQCDPNGRLTGGTAWSSGVHSTSSPTKELLSAFYGQNRHELAHTFQCLIRQGRVTAWLMEGFPGILGEPVSSVPKDYAEILMDNAVKAYWHRPNYENTFDYNNNYDYYTFGYFFNDFLYRKGGYELVKKVQQNHIAAYQSIGYVDGDAILNDFYFDYDVRYLLKPVVTLVSPKPETDNDNPAVNINWTPLKSDVKLNVTVSTDGGTTWTEIANKTTQTSCVWNAGNYTGNFYLKFIAPDNLNLTNTFGPFIITNPNKLILKSFENNQIQIGGDTTAVKWANTNISQLKIEFSDNNGASWQTIASNIAAADKQWKWIVPNGRYSTCKIRISDTSNASNNSESNVFRVVSSNNAGGPYVFDKNTLLLFHFDNDINNRSVLSGNPTTDLSSNIKDEIDTPADLANCYQTKAPLTIPHSVNLNLSGDWTIEAWVKLNSYNPNDYIYIVQKRGDTDAYQCNYALGVNPWWSNAIYGFYFSGFNSRFGVIGDKIELNTWYHIAFIRDTKKSEIRLIFHDKNRAKIFEKTAAYTPTETYLNSQNLIIGSGMDGYIDEVRISNVVRDFTPTGINDIKQEPLFSIYPNPSNGIIHINWKNETINGKISLINSLGAILLEKNIKEMQGYSLSLSHLAKGIYFLKLSDKNNSWTEKVILK